MADDVNKIKKWIKNLSISARISGSVGFSVISFIDPIKAFEHFTENNENYALVISDLRMPGLNGLELLKNVKELNPNVRTMLVSAFNMQDNPDFRKYLKDGVINSFVAKSITINRLCQKVRDEVETYDLGSKRARPQIK